MTDEEQAQPLAHAKQEKSILCVGMVRIMRHACLLKGNSMRADVLLILNFVPDEVYILHI